MKAPTIAAGVPAALTLVVLIPLIAANSVEEPPATKSALTVSLVADIDGRADTAIRLDAPGPPPAKGSFPLVDDGGISRGSITPAGESDCKDTPKRVAPPGGQAWCLEVNDAESGRALTAEIKGAAGSGGETHTLTVTTKVKDPFPLPLLAVLLGFALAAPLALIPPWLKRSVLAARLEEAVAGNEQAGVQRIDGLRAWCSQRKDADADIGDLLATVQTLIRTAAPQAAENRRLLMKQIDLAPPLPADAHLLSEAEAEARSTALKREHFLDDGGATAKHPATIITMNVTQLRALLATYNKLHAELDRAADGKEKDEARKTLQAGHRRLLEAEDADDLKEADRVIEEARDAIHKLTQTLVPKVEIMNVDIGTLDFEMAWPELEAALAELEAAPPTTPPTPPASTALGGSTTVARVVTGLVIAAIGVIAAIAVLSATYFSNATFGLWTDYLTLFLAAFGSSTAAAAFGIIVYWGRFQDAT